MDDDDGELVVVVVVGVVGLRVVVVEVVVVFVVVEDDVDEDAVEVVRGDETVVREVEVVVAADSGRLHVEQQVTLAVGLEQSSVVQPAVRSPYSHPATYVHQPRPLIHFTRLVPFYQVLLNFAQ